MNQWKLKFSYFTHNEYLSQFYTHEWASIIQLNSQLISLDHIWTTIVYISLFNFKLLYFNSYFLLERSDVWSNGHYLKVKEKEIKTYFSLAISIPELTKKQFAGRVTEAAGAGGKRSSRVGPAIAVQCGQLHHRTRVTWRSECYHSSWQSAPAPGPCSESCRPGNSGGCGCCGGGRRCAYPNATPTPTARLRSPTAEKTPPRRVSAAQGRETGVDRRWNWRWVKF